MTPVFIPPLDTYDLIDVCTGVYVAEAEDFGGAVLAYRTLMAEGDPKLRVVTRTWHIDYTQEVQRAVILELLDELGAYVSIPNTPHERASMASHAEAAHRRGGEAA